MRKKKTNLIPYKQLTPHTDIFLKNMRENWNTLQKNARKEILLQQTKEGGMIVAKTLLSLIAIGGVLTVATITPNVFGAFGKLTKNTTFINKKDFYKHKRYLTKRKLLKSQKNNDKTYTLTLTPYGATIVFKKAYNELLIKKQNTWDKKWRMVLFDIPEKHKSERESLREKLRLLGFYQLQRSVFVHPYPCFEEIKLIVSILNISGYVKFIEATDIIEDDETKTFFDLV